MIRKILAPTCIAVAMTLSAAWAECTGAPTEPDGRYIANGAMIYDKETRLTWQRCSVGQTWKDGQGCTGDVAGLTYDQAVKQAKGEWRLPTKEELGTLMSKKCSMPTIDQVGFPNSDVSRMWYWSSSTSDPQLAWLVYMNGGSTFNGYRTSQNALRLVKSETK